MSKIPSFSHLLFYKAYCEPKWLPVYSIASGIIETRTNCGDRPDGDRMTTRRDRKKREVKDKWKGGEGTERLEDYLLE